MKKKPGLIFLILLFTILTMTPMSPLEAYHCGDNVTCPGAPGMIGQCVSDDTECFGLGGITSPDPADCSPNPCCCIPPTL